MHKILLIDDEPDILRVLAMSLRADGYEVVTAASGEEGLAAFAEQRPDIVLVDIKMPGLDGIDVLQQVKAQDTLSEVIIITGHGDVDNAVEALKTRAEELSILLSTIPALVYFKDTKLNYILVNKAFERFVNLPFYGIQGKRVEDVLPDYRSNDYSEMEMEVIEGRGK